MKMIFKKCGLTAFSVLSAVGVVIGVIVSNPQEWIDHFRETRLG